MDDYLYRDNLPLNFFHIDPNNNITVRTINEPIDVFQELYGKEQSKILCKSRYFDQNVMALREKAFLVTKNNYMSQKEKLEKIKLMFERAEANANFGSCYVNSTFRSKNRSNTDFNVESKAIPTTGICTKSEGVGIASIPTQYTEGRHLYIAWKSQNLKFSHKPLCTQVSVSAVSYLISAAIGDSLMRGKAESKGKKNKTNFFKYVGEAIIFEKFEPTPFKMPTYRISSSEQNQLGKIMGFPATRFTPTFFWQVYQNCYNHFSTQYPEQYPIQYQQYPQQCLSSETQPNKNTNTDRATAHKYLNQYMVKPEILALDEEYQQMIKKHLAARIDKPECFDKVVEDVLQLKKRDDEFLSWREKNNIPKRPVWLT